MVIHAKLLMMQVAYFRSVSKRTPRNRPSRVKTLLMVRSQP